MSRVFYLAGGHGLLGGLDEVVTSESLTRLYGFPIDVVRTQDRVFVLSREGNVTESAHHD
jgi:zinc/manganese transport system ATP-binding protein